MARTDPPAATAPGPPGTPHTPAGAVGAALRQFYADATRLDLSQSDPVVAGRNALGLLAPLALAAALGSPAVGVQAAIGALQTAFADRPGPYRLRLARMLVTALAAGVTGGLAAGFGTSLLASAVLLAACAFAAGLLLAAGPSAAQVGVAATACALVLGHLPQQPLAAVYTGLLVFAGGALQAVLAIAAWPLGRHGPERRALAALYRRLAGLAEQPIDAATSPPLGEAIAATRAVLSGAGHDHGPSVEAYRVLLDEAMRARQDILVLSGYADRLRQDGLAEADSAIRAELGTAAAVLRSIAAALQAGGPVDAQRTDQLLGSAGSAGRQALGGSLTERAAASRLASLAGQLRAMVETARTGAGEGRQDEDAGRPGASIRLRDPIGVVRANLHLSSPALRHAARLAVLVPLTDVLTRAAGVERGYWVSLTILVVLRPDFGSTFQRSLLRVVGTLVGLLLTSLVLHYLLGDWQPGTIVLLGLLFFGVRLAGQPNFAWTSVFLAGLVVLLLSLAGFSAHSTVVDRSIDTVLGGAIALAAALVWPSWERGQLASRLADLLQAYRDYLQAIVDAGAGAARRSATRSQARLARSSAEASLDRARAEPVDSQGLVELGSAVLAHSHRLVHALTALDATRRASESYATVPEFRALVDAALAAIEALAGAVRDGRRPACPAGLRDLHAELTRALDPATRPDAPLPPELAATVIEATDRLVDSLNSLAAVLTEPPGR
ncbi:FUSC family protein [Jatrophihabitans sp.]|uniref:FUSC family protein n=1 Tax=Jatrophihabitans sp. TaxID=1932789 RepID=UPI002C4C513B|nr:FUSC family protein [Jatrophihabitans sp.]